MDLTESVTYKNLTEYEPYTTNEANAKIRPLRVPLLVTDSHTHVDGSKTIYTFKEPKYHTDGKGFIGFATLETSNEYNNVKTVSNYQFNEVYFFSSLTSQLISTINDNKNISHSSQTNSVKVIDSSLKRYIPYVSIQNNVDELNDFTIG